LALQRVLRGENLEDTNPEMAARYRAYMANADKASEKYEKDRERFVMSSLDEAVQLTEKQKVVLNQITQQKFSNFKRLARTNAHDKRLWMEDQIKNGPKVDVYVEPVVQIGRVGGQQVVQMEGVVIGLNGVRIYFPPGTNKMHPLFAQRYEQIKRSKQETEARKTALQADDAAAADWRPGKPDGWARVAGKMNKINAEFESTSGSGEAGDRWDTPELAGNF